MQQGDKISRKKAGALICAAIMIALLLVFLAVIIFPLLTIGVGDIAAAVILVIYAVLALAVIVGIIAALVSRLREINGGEEEEAKKY